MGGGVYYIVHVIFPLSYSSGVEEKPLQSLRNQTGVEIGVKSELGYLALSLQ